jgi:hypothetical protein
VAFSHFAHAVLKGNPPAAVLYRKENTGGEFGGRTNEAAAAGQLVF